MKLALSITRLAVIGVVVAAGLISACRHAPKTEQDRPQLTAGVRLQDVTFHSAALNRDMTYRVFLPSTISAGRKLPVVYLLHGAGDSYHNWSNDADVSRYSLKGLILVMPEGNTSYYMDAVEVTQNKYQDYITQELIANVESQFPAVPDRGHRAIVGVSMGGFAAIDYALTRPDLYSFTGALSPAIDVPSRRFSFKHADQWWRFRQIFGPVGSEQRQARDPFKLVMSASPQATPYIYMTAGEQEPLLDPIRRFAARLKQRGFNYELHTRPGGHDWAEWNSQIPDCFTSLFAHMATQPN